MTRSIRGILPGLLALSGVLALLLGATAYTATPASAAPGNILPPFSIGETWTVYQGYGPTAFSHHDNQQNKSLYGLDLTIGGTDISSAGAVVKAPVGGVVQGNPSLSEYGSMCINTADNRSLTLTHINTSITGGSVIAGQVVGTVAAAGDKKNEGIAHLHLQMWSGPGCWGTGNGGIPFDAAHNARICGAGDLDANGPQGLGSSGKWHGTQITGANCGTVAPPPARIVVRNGGNLYNNTVANSPWEHVSNSASAGFWLVTGDRIVSQDANGLWVKDGNAAWTRWGNGDSQEIQASSSRIVVRNGSNLYSNTGPNSQWELISNSATAGFWKLSGDRVVNQDANGLWVKSGNGGWTRWGDGNSDEIQVSGDRIVVRSGGNLHSNTNNSGWEHVSNSASAGFWKLSGSRLVSQDANGLWVKDGSSGWVRWGNGDSEEIQISPSRIVVRNGSNLFANTTPNTAWELISNTASAGFWKLSGDRVVNQDTNGLWVKDANGAWVRWGNGDSQEIQIS